MEIYEEDPTPQSKRYKNDPTKEAKTLSLREIKTKVSKEIGEIERPTMLLSKTPTRMMPYPSLEFTLLLKSKAITPSGPILMQTDLQSLYMEIMNINSQQAIDL